MKIGSTDGWPTAQPNSQLQQYCFNFPNRPCQAPSLLRDTIRDENK